MNWLGIIFVGCLIVIVSYLVSRNKRREFEDDATFVLLAAFGFAAVVYDREETTDKEAAKIVDVLKDLRASAMAKLSEIYDVPKARCSIDQLMIDKEYPKAAEWTRVVGRKLVVNPTKPEYLGHFCEEMHNVFRLEQFGMKHIYEPIDKEDRKRRELAQQAMKDLAAPEKQQEDKCQQ